MRNVYSELYTAFAEDETENVTRRETKRAGGVISVVEKTGRGSRAFDIVFRESLFLNDALQEEAIRATADTLSKLLKDSGYTQGDKVLFVALGNEGMTADSLGAAILSRLNVTGHLEPRDLRGRGILCALKASVSGVTGLASFDVVKGITERIKPDLILAADTLACSSPERLGRVIQFSDGGISPGSGVNNAKRKLDSDSLGCPVIALGVPLVIYLNSLLKKLLHEDSEVHLAKRYPKELADTVVTMKEIDVLVEDYARVIGEGINRAVHVSTAT